MTFLTSVWPSCSASPVYLFHHPITHLYTKLELWISSNRDRCLEILDAAAASSNHAPNKRIFVQRDLSCLHLILSKHNIYILYQNPSQSRISNVSVLISLVSLTFLCSLELWRSIALQPHCLPPHPAFPHTQSAIPPGQPSHQASHPTSPCLLASLPCQTALPSHMIKMIF